jgi:quinolinate synthase
MLQTILPEHLTRLSESETDRRIRALRESLGERLVILGHHYQRDEVIKFADIRGDSFKLAQWAGNRKNAEFIVFCGVHFMAESADILSGEHQKVILPDLSAGCSMADMAELDQVETCWEDLTRVTGERIVPITYMNSTAAIKAFCGRNGGAVCTSFERRGRHAVGAGAFGQNSLPSRSTPRTQLGLRPRFPTRRDGGLGSL